MAHELKDQNRQPEINPLTYGQVIHKSTRKVIMRKGKPVQWLVFKMLTIYTQKNDPLLTNNPNIERWLEL